MMNRPSFPFEFNQYLSHDTGEATEEEGIPLLFVRRKNFSTDNQKWLEPFIKFDKLPIGCCWCCSGGGARLK